MIAGGGDMGSVNTVNDYGATVGGGVGNTAGDLATVAGGISNVAGGNYSTVAGGLGNAATNISDTVGGGEGNSASGSSSTVAGGYHNTASGGASTVPGGSGSTASANYSFAAGLRAKALQDGSFVWADSNDFDMLSIGTNTFNVRSTGGARFVSGIDGSGSPTAGVSLAAGGGSWSSFSDRAAKRDFTDIDRGTLLQRLNRVPITRWGYKAQAPSIRHLGPMAQDFRSAFGLGEDAKHIDTIDSEGVALAAIQGLYRQNQALQRQNRLLNGRLARLERAFSKLSR